MGEIIDYLKEREDKKNFELQIIADTYLVLKTIAANVNNKDLSDLDFREYVKTLLCDKCKNHD